jgi:hypothetical protein
MYNEARETVRDMGSGFWLMSEYTLEELQNYYSSETPQWKLIKRDRAQSLSLPERRRIRREKWRAQSDACCVYARRYLENRHELLAKLLIDPEPHFQLGDDPKVVVIRPEHPLLIAVGAALLSIKPPPRAKTFGIDANGKDVT